MKKNIIIGVILVLLAIWGLYLLSNKTSEIDYEGEVTNNTEEEIVENNEDTVDEDVDESETVIGTSALGKDIRAYHFGEGEKELLLVGGIHGGYSWNTSELAYDLIEYFEENEENVPENMTVTVIPAMNPDGLAKVVGFVGPFSSGDVVASQSEKEEARFNGNDVDLNRNFDCDWNSVGTWQNKSVDGGSEPFSEPEAKAVKNYIESNNVDAVVVYYSSAGGVFSSSCHNGILDETIEMTNAYGDASGYKAFEEFDFYEITGDMVNWLAKEEVPAISVLLTNHSDIEWTKNVKGVNALLEYFAE